MSDSNKKKDEMPEKVTATNWSKIHEIAKKNELMAREPYIRNPSILRHADLDRNKPNGNPVHEAWRKSTTFSAGAMSVVHSVASGKEQNSEHVAYRTRPFWGVKGDDSLSKSEVTRLTGIISLAELFPCFKASTKCSKRMKMWARNKCWRVLVAIFEAILLIGPQVREFCPKESDTPFDVLFIITVVVLFVDILLMCYSARNYFNFRIDGPSYNKRRHSCRSNIQSAGSLHASIGVGPVEVADTNHSKFHITAFAFGGFIFWFDVISALSLLFDITMINPLLTKQLTVYLIPGMPHHGSTYIDTLSFLSYRRWYFMLVVLRTPRIVRLIQASGIVHLWLTAADKIFLYTRNRKLAKIKGEGEFKNIKYDCDSEAMQDPPAAKATTSLKSSLKGNAPQFQSSSKKLDKMSRFIQNREQQSSQPISEVRSQHRPNVKNSQSGLNRNAFDYLDTKLYKRAKKKKSSQVGKEMHELTVKHVALGCIIAIIVTALFTNHEKETYMASTILAMHGTLSSVQAKYGNDTSILTKSFNMIDLEDVNIISYEYGNSILLPKSNNDLREREKVTYHVQCDAREEESCYGYEESVGTFKISFWSHQMAVYTLLLVIFIVIMWYVAVSSFAGPIAALVIIPIERMIRILNMLVDDPLGYQRTPKYRQFVQESEDTEQHSKWKKANLEGMETSFLMSTILRIGSLMKVGFGDAGAQIIRQSLEKDGDENLCFKSKRQNSKTTVSCIFLFCDIRRFTDATECLREEVFVFTNKIAQVVHSLCHSYGGSANKNIGDAFLISWLLYESKSKPTGGRAQLRSSCSNLVAQRDEADKALLAVLKIIIALHYESFFLKELSAGTRERLQEKFADSSGPLVQMGFGLHAGKAVQGAIGSHRKLDATYISNAVEQAEYLESSTKKYGLKLLMSGEFYGLLTPGNKRRCRQIDQVFFRDDDGDEFEEPPNPDDFEKMELYTYDIDVNDIFYSNPRGKSLNRSASNSSHAMSAIEKNSVDRGSFVSSDVRALSVAMGLSSSARTPAVMSRGTQSLKDRDAKGVRRWSIGVWNNINTSKGTRVGGNISDDGGNEVTEFEEGELLLPTGRCIYNPSIWLNEDLRFVRGRYSHGQFFQEFNIGLQHYFSGEWDAARECLQAVDAKITDGPARYYLKKMQDANYVPPRGFTGWSEA